MATYGTVYNVCSKQPRDCNLVFLFINQQCMPKMFYRENVCSKQVRNYFLVYLSLISTVRLNVILQKMCSKQAGDAYKFFTLFFIYKKCVFKANGGYFFNLCGYFSNTKNVCSKQAGSAF